GMGTGNFFFQAEGGIRDFHVTGVQTCALPISFFTAVAIASVEALTRVHVPVPKVLFGLVAALSVSAFCWYLYMSPSVLARAIVRSEERRVGKGCRCRGEASRSDGDGGSGST